MATTYTLIASTVAGAGPTYAVDFTGIPSTYTDLVLRCSIRDGASAVEGNCFIKFNSSSTSDYSNTRVRGDGTNAASSRQNSQNEIRFQVNGNTSTSNTFSQAEIYIPNYASSNNKQISITIATENNATLAYIEGQAGLRSNTAAITSINLIAGNSILQGSSFYLYGIKNS